MEREDRASVLRARARHLQERRPELDSTIWQALPMEILLHIVDYLSQEEADTRTKQSLSLVCHKWLEQSAPVMYKNIALHSSRIQDLCQSLRHPNSILQRYVREISLVFDSFTHCVALSELAKLLPHAVTLNFSIVPQTVDLHRSHPNYARLTAISYATFQQVSRLQLSSYKFASFRDLRYLIGSLPSLSRIGLLEVTWSKCPLQTFRSHRCPRNLVNISSFLCTAMWPLLCCWSWINQAGGNLSDCFPGLQPEEAQIAATICQCTTIGCEQHGFLHLGRSIHPRVWVITVYYLSQYIEFHAVRDPPSHDMAYARIRWIVFHSDDPAGIVKNEDAAKLDEQLSLLGGLEQVVFETSNIEDCEATTNKLVRSRGLVVQLSHAEAAKRAQETREHGIANMERFPVPSCIYEDEVRGWWT